MPKFMVIETYREGCEDKVYERFHRQGRMLPPGLYYLDSWLERGRKRCFQLMETDHPKLFAEWTRQWEDFMSFEIVEIAPKPAPELHQTKT